MKTAAMRDAIETADAQVNNFGLPAYSALLDALLKQYNADSISERRAANSTARELLMMAGLLGGRGRIQP